MEDFNDMTEKLDEALAGKGNCRLYTGSYVGTGTKEQSFTFPAKPYFAAIMGGSFFIIMAHGITSDRVPQQFPPDLGGYCLDRQYRLLGGA